jgi:hypothetical protein
MVAVNLPVPTKGNALAVAALVLGFLAALICWVPFLGLLALPVGALGCLLGVIGLLIAIVGKRSGLAASIVGTGISFGAIVLSLAVTGATSKAISDANKTEAAPVARASQPVEKAAQEPIQPIQLQPKGALFPQRVTEKEQDDWVIAPTPAVLGDVEVKVVSAKIAPVSVKGPIGERESQDPQLILLIKVSNISQNRKLDYRTWGGENLSFQRDFTTLRDNFKNSYRRISFGIFDRPVGRVEADSIYPGKSLTDVLIFENPLENVQHLELELPAKDVDTEGLFKILIPAAMIERSLIVDEQAS